MTPISALLIFALTSLILVSFSVLYTYASQGFAYGFSANRPAVEKTDFGKRVDRTWMNHVESAALVVPILAAIAFLGVEAPAVMTGIAVLIWARVGFAVTYLTGIPYARLPFFLGANLASMFLLYQIWLAVGVAVG